MRKMLFYSFIAIFSIAIMKGCGVEASGNVDTTPPVITIVGSETVTLYQGLEYIEEGATAVDDADGSLEVTISGAVDTYVSGTYTISYAATDNAGNNTTETRTVIVEPIGFRAVVGYVRDFSTGERIPNVSVNVGTQTVITDVNGVYIVPVDVVGAIERLVVNIGGNVYAKTGEVVSIGSGDTDVAFLNVDAVPVAVSGTFDASQGFTVQVANSPAQVIIEGDSLVDGNGTLAVGSVNARVTPINPSLNIDILPGDMKVSSGESIASFGALTINFEDAQGNALNLEVGKEAMIRIPASSRGEAMPATISLFYFDKDVEGYLFENGNATLSSDGTYYEGKVGHFSTWNADYIYEEISVNGCVQDSTENRVPNASVRLDGNDYNGMNTATTDVNGDFTVLAKKNAESLISATLFERISNTVIIGDDEDTSASFSLSNCLIMGAHSFAVRLTWGLSPGDLDTHVIGPNESEYHIMWTQKGSLTEEPFANLDVDDTTSYGPEVFTAFSFPEPGRYHYAVYNWSGIPNGITSSPARVEIILDGESTVFTPPPGETDQTFWWNVFDFIVSEEGDISIVEVNTWSTDEDAPGPISRIAKEVRR